MSVPFKPRGYNAVSPYFIVTGADRFIDLLKQIFNAKPLRRYEMPDGSVMHAEVQVEDSVVMLGEASAQYPANKSIVHVYVPDVDRVFERALAAGCESVEPPKEREGDPDRRATFRDPFGNMWSVGMQVREEASE